VPFVEADLHLSVVVRVPDHHTGDGGAQGGQFHVVRQGGDLGKANCVRYVIEEEEDTERLSADDPSADVRTKGEYGSRGWPAPVDVIRGRHLQAVGSTELGHWPILARTPVVVGRWSLLSTAQIANQHAFQVCWWSGWPDAGAFTWAWVLGGKLLGRPAAERARSLADRWPGPAVPRGSPPVLGTDVARATLRRCVSHLLPPQVCRARIG
jgi:hypothetical protein